MATFLVWAYLAQIDEVARGAGRVIPSSKRQIIQSLEGGIVKAISVHEGDKVQRGQTLLLLDKTGFASDLGELEAKELALQGALVFRRRRRIPTLAVSRFLTRCERKRPPWYRARKRYSPFAAEIC
jgi:multidrug efflux pump subunit AcrA (membrane-fusion protein)